MMYETDELTLDSGLIKQMRKTTQSMYQSGKNTMPNQFSMPNKLGSVLEISSLAKSSMGPQRKLEGQDILKTTKTNFEQTVNNLKSKPTQKVLEDEYISGLQEEIKFLQYELKLLKDKEIMEREGVNELDNFLKDQIPINENILAMKNKYNATKAKLEEQLQNFGMKNAEASDVLMTQKNQIKRLSDITAAHRKEKKVRRQEFKDKITEVTRQLTMTREEYEQVANQNKRKHEEIKKLGEQIAVLQRKNEKEKIMEVRLMEEKSKKQDKFQQMYSRVKRDMIQAMQKIEEMQELGDKNPLAQQMENQNSLLRKKIMLNQKQKSTSENIIAQINLFLKDEERQRQVERQQKSKYLNIGEELRGQLQTLQRFMDNTLRDKTVRHKKILIKQMNNDLHEKQQIYDMLTDRLRNLEQECSNLIQEKKELQDAEEAENILGKQLLTKIEQIDDETVKSKSKAASLRRVFKQIVTEIAPIANELEKSNGRIPIVQREIQKKNTTIHYLNKQIDLLKELKNLDLEQLQMVSQGGEHMQNIMHSFIKNWEKIKSV